MAKTTPHDALIHIMVTMSAADRSMTDAELGKIGTIITTLPVFKGYTPDMMMTAAHAHAAAGLAFQFASASPIAMRGKSSMSGFSFDRPPGHLVVLDASRLLRFQAPPEGLGKAEQRLLQDRHHQPVGDRPSGFLRFDEPRLLQHGEMGRHGRLRHREVIGQFSR